MCSRSVAGKPKFHESRSISAQLPRSKCHWKFANILTTCRREVGDRLPGSYEETALVEFDLTDVSLGLGVFRLSDRTGPTKLEAAHSARKAILLVSFCRTSTEGHR